MRSVYLVVITLLGLLFAPLAPGQQRPYIGFVYPAGGQQGTTLQIRLGGQNIDDLKDVYVSGNGVTARIVDYHRRLNPQEMQLLNEQLRILKPAKAKVEDLDEASRLLAEKIQERISSYIPRPANNALASIAIVEITVAPSAAPGRRELTLTTQRGVSNPMPFHVGQLPETSRKPMLTAHFQVLGKENLALRKRPEDEIEKRVAIPCTVNGQIASGEVNRYRFEARKGQKLVISTMARALNPFVADAVPGWFQPVLQLFDAQGQEVAYNDDYRFRPDPVILFEIPADGEYVLAITDAIYRGREDFVYRISIGELPFITAVFPLGGRMGEAQKVEMKGWNLKGAKLALPAQNAVPGVHAVAADRAGFASNVVPFELGTLPEAMEQEPNDKTSAAQKVSLPLVVNGRIGRADDWDVYQFTASAGQMIVAEVNARRLESPLDSFLKITDASGAVLAFNDDQADPEAGNNTHDADSYLAVKIPADGTYCVHVGDTARAGGEGYGYRVRISEQQPDFSLRVVPASVALRGKNTAFVTVHAFRKDGFDGAIQVDLKDPPAGFSAAPIVIKPGQQQVRLTLRTTLAETKQPVSLTIAGSAKVGPDTIERHAVPAEDRMQAFLWRHLVPAEALEALVYDAAAVAPPRRVPRTIAPTTAPVKPEANRPKFTKQQVAARLRQLKTLFEDGLLTDEFYRAKVEECEASL